MTLSLIDAAAGVISLSDYNANNTAIENAVNSFDGSNLQSGTVANAALVNSEAEFFFVFPPIRGNATVTSFLPVALSQDVVVKAGAYYTNDDGSADGSIAINYGSISSGSFSSAGSLGSVTLPGGSNTLSSANVALTGTIPEATTVLQLVLTKGTDQMSASSAILTFSLRCVSALTT